jgi:hypothetical protein
LCPPNKHADAPPQSFCNAEEHGKGIDIIISMMKNGNGDIDNTNMPEVLINGNILNFMQYIYNPKTNIYINNAEAS